MSVARSVLRDELVEAADEIREFDHFAAQQLESLADATVEDAPTDGWEHLDPIRAIDPSRLAMVVRRASVRNRTLGILELARNVLVLFPIFFTWLGLEIAISGYRDAISADQTLADQPFILLWQNGFEGHGGFWSSVFTLGVIAGIDAVVILIVIVITGYMHYYLNVRQTGLEQRSLQLESYLRHLLWQASKVISRRTTPEGQFDQLVSTANNLLDEISAERDRIGTLSNERERTIAGFGNAVKAFSESTGRMLEGTASVDKAMDRLQSTMHQSSEIEKQLSEGIAGFTRASETNNRLHHRTAEDLNRLVSNIEGATELLTRASLDSHSSSNALSQSIELQLAEIAGLRADLRAERDEYLRAAGDSKAVADKLEQTLSTALQGANDLVGEARNIARMLSPLSEVPTQIQRASQMAESNSAELSRLTGETQALRAEAGEVISAARVIQGNSGRQGFLRRGRTGRK